MKKRIFALAILGLVFTISSCDYDDSNDIDVITPVDETETSVTKTK